MIRRLAASASAIPLFSTAAHWPYALVKGSDDVEVCSDGLNVARSSNWAVKITFEAGYRMPRITSSMFA